MSSELIQKDVLFIVVLFFKNRFWYRKALLFMDFKTYILVVQVVLSFLGVPYLQLIINHVTLSSTEIRVRFFFKIHG